MSLAIDTNILLYAHRRDVPQHAAASRHIAGLLDSGRPVGIPWPCAYEFLRVATHPRVYERPATVAETLAFLRALRECPSVTFLSETDRHAEALDRLLESSGVAGNLIHDAHVAALAIEHGFDEILTEDRDFSRFTGIRVVRLGT